MSVKEEQMASAEIFIHNNVGHFLGLYIDSFPDLSRFRPEFPGTKVALTRSATLRQPEKSGCKVDRATPRFLQCMKENLARLLLSSNKGTQFGPFKLEFEFL